MSGSLEIRRSGDLEIRREALPGLIWPEIWGRGHLEMWRYADVWASGDMETWRSCCGDAAGPFGDSDSSLIGGRVEDACLWAC